MENKRIQTENLDFDGIKQGFKTFLQGQEKFSDYNFEGSGLSILLDILAYNTHYNALYTNLAINEAFLDSASKRNSIVSKAKELGYVPRSYRSSTANLNLVLSFRSADINITYLELPKYTRFEAVGENQSYNFYTTEAKIAPRNGRSFNFQDIEVKQGTPLQYRYIAAPGVDYKIPNKKIDISTLVVQVQETLSSSTYEVFAPVSSVLNLNSTSAVYFVKEIDDEYFQIEFGNNIIGKGLNPGNVVTLEYMVCEGEDANDLLNFSFKGRTYSTQQSAVVSISGPSYGGAGLEDIESIRYNAPHYYTAQNRCVTGEDYKTLITSLYPEAKSVTVWGGEQNSPPIYGNVYISIIPQSGEQLTETEKQYLLTEIIAPRQMMSIHPVFVNPIYLKLLLNVTYHYDSQKTNLKALDIDRLILNNLNTYNDDILVKFDGVFRHSNVTKLIDQSDPSIKNSIVNTKILYQFPIVFNTVSQYVVNLYNPIFNFRTDNESVISNGIVVSDNLGVTSYIDDVPVTDSNIGKLRLFYYNGNTKVLIRYVGSINYLTGELQIQNLNILRSTSLSLDFTILPAAVDIISTRNQIAIIDSSAISITAVNTKVADSYKFTGKF